MTQVAEANWTPETRTALKWAAILTLLLGIVAIVAPFAAGIAVTLILAANFVLSGVLGVVSSFRTSDWRSMFWLLIFGIVSILAGLYMFAHPVIGLGTLTVVAIIAIFLTGAVKVAWGFQIPYQQGRWWVILSGILSILVAAALYSQFPLSAAWAFGVLVGVNLIAEGVAFLMMLSDGP